MCSENALFSVLNISEDAPVESDGDKKWKKHADADEENGVVVGGSAVPQTLLGLVVELVRRPAKVVRWVECETGQPRQNDGNESATASKHRVVRVVPADVQVAVECDNSNSEQRHNTADDAEAACSRTQPASSIQQLLLSHHRTFNIVSIYSD